MTPGAIILLVIAVPLVLFPAGFVWYLNVAGTLAERRRARKEQQAGLKLKETARVDGLSYHNGE